MRASEGLGRLRSAFGIMSLTAVILAAGKSTRMKSRRPKALHEVCGRPMLQYILQACYDAGVTRALVVVGHGKDEVMATFAGDERIRWVEQTEQLGTGHAARMCEPELRQVHGDVFLLAGDVPLLRGEVLTTLLQAHRDEHAAASMATAILDDPTGYGRIVRDDKGEFVEIVEQVTNSLEDQNIKGDQVVVDVAGAVMTPGVYSLQAGARIGDALVASGSLTEIADTEWVAQNLNLAQEVKDGGKIYIPVRRHTGGVGESASQQLSGSASQQGMKIDINTASQSELESLNGVGEARAQAIISNRPYSSLDELTSKAKIPQSVYEKIKDSLRVY